jgi:hypothetical protein
MRPWLVCVLILALSSSVVAEDVVRIRIVGEASYTPSTYGTGYADWIGEFLRLRGLEHVEVEVAELAAPWPTVLVVDLAGKRFVADGDSTRAALTALLDEAARVAPETKIVLVTPPRAEPRGAVAREIAKARRLVLVDQKALFEELTKVPEPAPEPSPKPCPRATRKPTLTPRTTTAPSSSTKKKVDVETMDAFVVADTGERARRGDLFVGRHSAQ